MHSWRLCVGCPFSLFFVLLSSLPPSSLSLSFCLCMFIFHCFPACVSVLSLLSSSSLSPSLSLSLFMLLIVLHCVPGSLSFPYVVSHILPRSLAPPTPPSSLSLFPSLPPSLSSEARLISLSRSSGYTPRMPLPLRAGNRALPRHHGLK